MPPVEFEALLESLGEDFADWTEDDEAEFQAEHAKYNELPPIELMDMPDAVEPESYDLGRLTQVLQRFRISGVVDETVVGPAITTTFVKPYGSVRISTVEHLNRELAFYLQVPSVHVLPDNTSGRIQIQTPNKKRKPVQLRGLLFDEHILQPTEPLKFPAGVTTEGRPVWCSLKDMPHLLIGGTTGAGKSVFVHSLITSLMLLYGPLSVQFALVDPKQGVEFGVYDKAPHLWRDPAYNIYETSSLLENLVAEMEKRYQKLRQLGARSIDDASVHFPCIVVVVDELASLLQGDFTGSIENEIIQLAQLGRAAGIHLVLATQRPSHDVVTGRIKANFPARLALQVASAVDSRVILGTGGAESLFGLGDALLHIPGKSIERLQSAYVDKQEVERVVRWYTEHTPPSLLLLQ